MTNTDIGQNPIFYLIKHPKIYAREHFHEHMAPLLIPKSHHRLTTLVLSPLKYLTYTSNHNLGPAAGLKLKVSSECHTAQLYDLSHNTV